MADDTQFDLNALVDSVLGGNSDSGNESDDTPSDQSDQSTDSNPPANEGDKQPIGTTGGDTGEEDETPQSIRDYLAKNPEHKAVYDLINNEVRKGLTPKLQEAAEIRKRLEAFNPEILQFAETLQQAYAYDPTGQAARQYVAGLFGVQPQQPEDDQDDYDLDPQTREIQQIKQYIQQQESAQKRQQLLAVVEREYDEIQTRYGLEISREQRDRITQWGIQNGYPTTESAFLAYEGTLAKILEGSVRKGRDEGSQILQEKVNSAPPPVSTNSRTAPAPDLPAGDLDALIGAVYDQVAAR